MPISHQPRELITEIIADASTKFPEFASCVRKRIRTFLKSYRRSKKIKEVVSVSPAQNGVTSSASKVTMMTVCVCVSVCQYQCDGLHYNRWKKRQ